MSKKANPTFIGLFIVVGVALGVLGLLLFSSSRLFTHSISCVLYFDGSLNGLSKGAPVKYRGVTIGSVTKVLIHANQARYDYTLPVIVEIQQNLINERIKDIHMFQDKTNFQAAVVRGLRGALESESLVTGVLYVGLEFVPNAPPPTFHQLVPDYVEIPTQPNDIQQLMQNLARVDFKGLENHLSTLITDLDGAIAALNLKEMSGRITNLLVSLDRTVSSREITNTLISVQKTMGEYQALAQNLNSRVEPLVAGITNTLDQANQTLAQLTATVQDLGGMLAPDSPLQNDLSLALGQLAGASQSVAALAEFLKRHPNSLIVGRAAPAKKP
jgi:paraquat-inducible protein B